MGCNYFEHAPHFGFQYLHHFLSKKHGALLYQVENLTFIFHTRIFFYIARHFFFEVLKSFVFGALKKMSLWCSFSLTRLTIFSKGSIIDIWQDSRCAYFWTSTYAKELDQHFLKVSMEMASFLNAFSGF